MDGATANSAGWRALVRQLGFLLIGVSSTLMLFSFGSQIIGAGVGILFSQWPRPRRVT